MIIVFSKISDPSDYLIWFLGQIQFRSEFFLRPDNEIRRIGLIFKDNIYSRVSLIRANWDSVNLCPIINPKNSLIVSGNVERHLVHLFSNFYYLFFAQFIWKKAGIDLKFFRLEIKIHVLKKLGKVKKCPDKNIPDYSVLGLQRLHCILFNIIYHQLDN